MQSIVESLLFAADKPLTLKQLGDLARARPNWRGCARPSLPSSWRTRAAAFQLHQVAGGYQFRTNPENAQWVQKLLARSRCG